MNKNILLIEKNKQLREFWIDVLQDEGATITTIDSDEALLGSKDLTPDLIFLGTGVNETDTRGLLESMNKRNRNLTVVTPANSDELLKELNAIQAQGLNYKDNPIKVDEVRTAIRKAIKIQELKERYNFKNLVGESQKMQEVFKAMAQVLKSSVTSVLVLGETGTGKEEVAKAIHYNSDRAEKPFMAISCTAVPETLMESELFGHEQGAFTDAKTTKKGLLELANGGTVFLDEIGDMKLSLQAKLLRFLEERKTRRIGSTIDTAVDVRIIAATNRHLEELVKRGEFREDLYYRLKVFPIFLPPLKERKEDIPLLAWHFINYFNTELGKNIKGISFSGKEKLMSYDWPGNVRELKNVMERAVILCTGEYVSHNDIILEGKTGDRKEKTLSLSENEKRIINAAIDKAGGIKTKAAELLGITRFALRNRMKKYKIE